MEKNFLKEENEKLKCQLDEMKYKLEKSKIEKSFEYQIFLKDDMSIIANVKEDECPGIVWEGLISYGDVTISLDEFKCAVPVKCDNE